MEKSKRKNGEMPILGFRNIKMLKVGAFINILLILGTLFYSMSTKKPEWMLILFLIGTGTLVFAFLGQTSESVTIYNDGIEYQLGNRYIFVEWHQLSHFESHKYGRKSEQGIKIHSSVSQEKVENFVDDQIYRKPFDDFIPVSRVTEIPIKAMREGVLIIDLRRLKSTEFGRLINEYAPHLFEGEGS